MCKCEKTTKVFALCHLLYDNKPRKSFFLHKSMPLIRMSIPRDISYFCKKKKRVVSLSIIWVYPWPLLRVKNRFIKSNKIFQSNNFMWNYRSRNSRFLWFSVSRSFMVLSSSRNVCRCAYNSRLSFYQQKKFKIKIMNVKESPTNVKFSFKSISNTHFFFI
jgi:hypothetical protein